MPLAVIIWYLLAYVLLGYIALNSSSHVSDSYAGLAFAIPMIGIPITLVITVWGIGVNIARKRFGVMLGYMLACTGLYGLLRIIVA
jgi:hypothetical protein